MRDIESDWTRAKAQDLVETLCAYELELDSLPRDWPGAARLRAAIGAALAEARAWVSHQDGSATTPPTRH